LIQEIRNEFKKKQNDKATYKKVSLLKKIRNLFLEFGFAEALDSFYIRPALMYLALNFFTQLEIGILVGKISADIAFYIFAIPAYELRKKILKN
jgi:hypothetical protein